MSEVEVVSPRISVVVHHSLRALAILEAMNAKPVSLLHDIAARTSIPKPAIIRHLRLLAKEGYVVQASRGAYVLAERSRHLSVGYRNDIAVVHVARPLMERLTAKIKWPLALGLLERATMVIRHSTIPSSPLAWYRTTLYSELSVLQSGMGMAMLAFMEADIREVIIELAPTPPPSDPIPFDLATFLEKLAITRERGFAVRRPSLGHPTMSLSVPILHEHVPIAAISVTLFGKAMENDAEIKAFVAHLTELAAEVASSVELAAS